MKIEEESTKKRDQFFNVRLKRWWWIAFGLLDRRKTKNA